MRTTALVLTALFLFTFTAKADTYLVTSSVDGDTVLGAGQLLSSPEIFNAQFEMDSTTLEVIPGTMTFSSSGPLGPLSYISSPSALVAYNWSNGDGLGIQLWLTLFLTQDGTILPGPYPNGTLYLNYYGFPYLFLNGTTTIVDTAEPPSMFLLMLSLLAVFVFANRYCASDSLTK